MQNADLWNVNQVEWKKLLRAMMKLRNLIEVGVEVAVWGLVNRRILNEDVGLSLVLRGIGGRMHQEEGVPFKNWRLSNQGEF